MPKRLKNVLLLLIFPTMSLGQSSTTIIPDCLLVDRLDDHIIYCPPPTCENYSSFSERTVYTVENKSLIDSLFAELDNLYETEYVKIDVTCKLDFWRNQEHIRTVYAGQNHCSYEGKYFKVSKKFLSILSELPLKDGQIAKSDSIWEQDDSSFFPECIDSITHLIKEEGQIIKEKEQRSTNNLSFVLYCYFNYCGELKEIQCLKSDYKGKAVDVPQHIYDAFRKVISEKAKYNKRLVGDKYYRVKIRL